MIVVVEGPSAAGKTSWVRRHHSDVGVWERQSSTTPPDRSTDPVEAAEFWVRLNAARWSEALDMEASRGLAVCDTDPFKLHYAWSLWRVDAIDREAWRHEARVARLAFAEGELGLADLYLVDIPTSEELRVRREGDSTRKRRNFELHARLGGPIKEWYTAVDSLDPGRVRWELPDQPLSATSVCRRKERTGTSLFDALLVALPEGE